MDSIYFSFDNLLQIVWWCLAAVVVSMFWLLVFYRRRLKLKGAITEPDDDNNDGADTATRFPNVSVIVYANDNPTALAGLLNKIFEQDYPASFEVIVVNDGSSEEVTDVVNRMTLEHPNIYVTFVPEDAHNLSRKKLAISLGVKGARYEVVMLTCAECGIESNNWMRHMAAPFTHGKDVVLGFAQLEGLRGVMNRYDQAATSVAWISAAAAGHPYRGLGYNLAYRRQLFFDAKGFSRSLTLHSGDDDLFINQITNKQNTAVVLTPGSVLRVNYFNPERGLRELRLRHSFTGRQLPHGSRWFFGLSTCAMWLWLAATVLGIVFSLPNALPACLFVAFIPMLWIPLVLAWRGTARKLNVKLSLWCLPALMLTRCVRNLRYKCICGRTSRRNYTWLQH